MNRESETYFRDLPEVHITRSKIEKPHGLKTTWSVANCVPIYVDDILPGTTVTMRMAAVMRMQTPLYPTMQNLYTDFLWFFVPYRLVWDHFKGFWGESTSAWYPTPEYEVPQITTEAGKTFGPKTIADYMGLPVGVAGLSVNALAFRSYVKIWNDWFRADAVDQEVGNTSSDNDYVYGPTYAYRGGNLLKANKMHDMFTSALPFSQAGPDVTIPLGTVAPVYGRTTNINPTDIPNWSTDASAMKYYIMTNGTFSQGMHAMYGNASSANTKEAEAQLNTSTTSSITGAGITPINLWADLSNASAATVNLLRSSIAIQHFYEQRARYGTKYIEFLRGVFGVVSPDARLQRSEYLGGRRVPHQIGTVLQTSSTDSTSPQGNTGAYSHTVDSGEYFTKSFTEHGVLMCIMVTRYKHTYEQGIPAMFSRKKWTQWYIPQFQGLGEEIIPNKAIYAQGTSTDEEAFGFQEYGYSYRYMPDQVTAEMRSSYSGTLNSWHYGDNYNSLPVLGSTWLKEDRSNVDRTLVVSSGLADQLFGDFYFNPTYVLPMPIYSIPGLNKI